MSKFPISWLPSLNALRAFNAVARHRSFQKAAEELNVTSAAVQQLVRGLENTLDVDLIIRNGRQLDVTPRGEAALIDLSEGFGNLSKAVEKIRSFSTRQQLRISVEPSFAASWLIDRLPQFQDQYGDIDVLIESTNRIVDLKKGEADIALRYSSQIDKYFHFHRLFEDEIIAVCNPALLEGETLPLKPDDLLRIALIQYDWPHNLETKVDWKDWIKWMDFNITPPVSRLRFDDYNLSLQSTIAGMGIGLASRPHVQHALESGLLVEPFESGVINGCGYDILFDPLTIEKPGIKEFTDWIIGEAKG